MTAETSSKRPGHDAPSLRLCLAQEPWYSRGTTTPERPTWAGRSGRPRSNVKKLFAKIKATANSRTCSIVLTSTAPVQLSHGTRACKGIHGSVTVKLVDAMIMPRMKNGQCAPGESNAKPLAEVGLVTGSGRVSW